MTATISRPPLSDRLASSKVIAVLRAPHVAALAPVCDVLVEEGILGIELTLTTPDLLGALSDLVDRYTATADVGVGTILTKLDAQRAIDSGAQFLVTPTMNLPVIKLAVQRQIAVFPGGLTPTELAAGAVAVSIGGPLLGDALNGGDLSALRDRCGAVRAVVAETVLS